MVLDHAEITPNPARGIKMPEHDSEEVNPPTASHVEAVYRLLPKSYRLPTIVLDQTGMRVGELENLTWGDVDEHAGRWRVSRTSAKTRKARWVPVPAELFVEVLALKPREDRAPTGQVLAGFTANAYRTSLMRACKAAGVPQFSPHDLRHRRATLWHLAGSPAAEAAGWLGHSPQEHLRTYAHVLIDRTEINLSEMLGLAQTGHTDRHTLLAENPSFAGRS
jgi:integrase